ncbi:MAG: hypothetical protein ACREMW_15080 [Gemmatimonadales bacterium]
MTRFSTIDPPAAISFFTPAGGVFGQGQFAYSVVPTNARSDVSLIEARIRSAFEGAQKELGRYERYSPRWDGYRAQPFSTDVLCCAAGILEYSQKLFLNAHTIPELVTTGPASDGSIDVELRMADKRVLITLYPKEDQARFLTFEAEEAHEHSAPLGRQALERWFAWLRQPNPVPTGVDQDPLRSR